MSRLEKLRAAPSPEAMRVPDLRMGVLLRHGLTVGGLRPLLRDTDHFRLEEL